MIKRKYVLLLIFFFLGTAAIWVAPGILHLGDFLFHPNAAFSDLLISHWPNMQFIRDAWKTWGEFPLWNPQILSGAPLVGDPLFGIWYLPNWLSFLLPIGVAFNLLFWLHLAWAGFGMYLWMRSEEIHWGGALLAGIVFSGMPKLVGHIGLGHFGLVSSVAWTPWLLLVISRTVRSISNSENHPVRWFTLSGVVAGIIFLADPRWIIPAGGLGILYASHMLYLMGTGRKIISLKGAIYILSGLLVFVGIISGLAVPMAEFTSKSTRVGLSPEEISNVSLPLNNLLGLFIPQYSAWPETITFAGIIVLGLSLVAIVGRATGRFFWLGITFGSLLLALGDQTPIYPVLVKLIPGLNFLRVPARFTFLSFFSLATLAGKGLNTFLQCEFTHEVKKRIRLALVGMVALLLLISIGSVIILNSQEVQETVPWQHMSIGALLLFILGFYSLRDQFSENWIIALWVGSALLDLFLMNRTLIESRSQEELFKDPSSVIAQIHSDENAGRVFSPSYSLPQNIVAVNKLQLADGVNPLQLNNYWQYMAEAVGFDPGKYSVTLPPFPDGDPSLPRYGELDTNALGFLNVGYVVSAYPIVSDHLEKLQEKGDIILYRNVDVRPRVWIVSDPGKNDRNWREADSIEWSPNSITIHARGSGLLVLSEIAYPGWKAFINGHPVEIKTYHEILRSISLQQGENFVEFEYRPWAVYLGTVMTGLTLVIFGFIWWRK